MKLVFTFIILLVFNLHSQAQVVSPEVANTEKKLEVAESIKLMEPQYDFGRIPQGKEVKHVFLIKNVSNSPLAIENVLASCGCTTPEWSKEMVPPGQTARIVVGYNAATEGAFNKNITLMYNKTETKIITIKGEVWKTPLTSAPLNQALENLKSQL